MIKTWGGRSSFNYSGSVEKGTEISYGKSNIVRITAQQYLSLRKHFLNNVVPVGTSRTDSPKGSLGSWLQINITRTAIASYVAPILIREGYAKKEDDRNIRIIK